MGSGVWGVMKCIWTELFRDISIFNFHGEGQWRDKPTMLSQCPGVGCPWKVKTKQWQPILCGISSGITLWVVFASIAILWTGFQIATHRRQSCVHAGHANFQIDRANKTQEWMRQTWHLIALDYLGDYGTRKDSLIFEWYVPTVVERKPLYQISEQVCCANMVET